MDDLDLEFQRMMDVYLESIKSRVEELMKDAIETEIYEAYTPVSNGYQRTYTFLNSVVATIDSEGGLFVHVDLNEGTQYYSAVDGSPQYLNISKYLEGGHSDSTGINNMYHNYSPTSYLEKTSELISKEFPELQIEIVK